MQKRPDRKDTWENKLEPEPVCEINGRVLRARMHPESNGWGTFQVGFLVTEGREFWHDGDHHAVTAEFFHLKGYSSESLDKATAMAVRKCQ